ncbi:unnamed protein product [Trichobilharzia szidati]|nr:unnamed protein product [Trichobilharzia szidati]
MSRGVSAVRILLLGEPRVGKTTLILSLVSEEFSPKVPAQAEEITIPEDVTPEHIPTQIVDYSSQTQSHEQLCAEIKRANVICLVHALDDENSFKQISAYWLPLIRHVSTNADTRIPIVLVGNKLDINHESKLDKMLPLMSEYCEVETCIECSAKTMLNLSETFWFAQKAVLYPTAPLYNAEKKELTPECIRALTRIFRICDIDNDGYLSDRELEAFQTRCFSIPLTAQSLRDVKQLVKQSCPGGVTVNGLTQKGFLFLHLMFVQKGRHETTWTVLRRFGYGNHMRLSEEYLYPKFCISPGCSTEISPVGMQFLNTLFNKYDLDRDGCLSTIELSELLATCPEDQLSHVIDMGLCVTTNPLGWATRQGFLAFWMLTAYLEPNRLLEYFAYLGFTYYELGSFLSISSTATLSNGGDTTNTYDSITLTPNRRNHQDMSSIIHKTTGGGGGGGGGGIPGSQPFASHRTDLSTNSGSLMTIGNETLLKAIIITNHKRIDAIRRSTQRTVFYCRVYGARNVGKTCLMQGLIGRSLNGSGGNSIGGIAGRTSNWVAACGIPVYGQSRTLLMHEISASAGEQMSANEALSADVACLVYDVSDCESFRYVANIFLNFYRGTRVPCLFVAAKSDQSHVIQNYQIDPSEMATKYNIPPPEPFSSVHLSAKHTPSSALNGYEDKSAYPVRRRRAGSAEPASSSATSAIGDSSSRVKLSSQDLLSSETSIHHNGREDVDSLTATTKTGGEVRTRHLSRSDLHRNSTTSIKNNFSNMHQTDFHPVYILLCTMANYPHYRGFELSQTDHAWKWTLAATILAGFGFFAFHMAKTHT